MRTELLTQAFENKYEFRDIVGSKLQKYDFFVMSFDKGQRLMLCVDFTSKFSVKGICINPAEKNWNSKPVDANNAYNCRLDINSFMIVTDQVKFAMPELYNNMKQYIEKYEQKKAENKNKPKDVNFIVFSFLTNSEIINNLMNISYQTAEWGSTAKKIANYEINEIEFAISVFTYEFKYDYKIQSIKDAFERLKSNTLADTFYILTNDGTFVKAVDAKPNKLKYFVVVDDYIQNNSILYYIKKMVLTEGLNMPFYLSNIRNGRFGFDDEPSTIYIKRNIDYSYYNQNQTKYFERDKIKKVFDEYKGKCI